MSSALKPEIEKLTCPRILDGAEQSFAGSFTTSIYDTSWVACIRKNGRWLYPRSFEYVVQRQLPSGLWHSGSSTSDILNGLGGLRALLAHAEDDGDEKIVAQAERAADALREVLQLWDIDAADNVGFEVLIPAMLELLSKKSLIFDFPSRKALSNLYETRLSKLPFEQIYERGGAILHSAEAFYNVSSFDFDRLQKHRIRGSIMGSPAASAAYLMRSSSWDDETEAYLDRALSNLASGSNFGVPSAYPSRNFELTWAITTLLDHGWDSSALPEGLETEVFKTLEESGALEGSCIGFMANVEPDLDDTARSSITLNLLGKPGVSKSMIQSFDNGTHCITYAGERNVSLSANCNALYALLLDSVQWKDCEDVWREKVHMLLSYLTSAYWTINGYPLDKWNHSPWYSLMLLAQSLTKAVTSENSQPALRLSTTMKERMALLLLRCVAKSLSEQLTDGSWGRTGPFEETAYVVILLSFIQQSGFIPSVSEQISSAITKAQSFLKRMPTTLAAEPVWIEKVDYGSALVSRCYILAAMETPTGQVSPPLETLSSKAGPSTHFLKVQVEVKKVFKQLPLLEDCPAWLIDLSGAEAGIYYERLREVSSIVVMRQGFTKDKYLAIIPFIWTVANNLCRVQVSCDFILDMMIISFLNYQIDELIELSMDEFGADMQIVEDYIQNALFRDEALASNDTKPSGMNGALQDLFTTLHRFKDYITNHDKISTSSQQDQELLVTELQRFLLAHIVHAKDNQAIREHRDSKSASSTRYKPNRDFKSWLKGIASTSTSCVYSFTFAMCLIGSNKDGLFRGLEQKYLADDLMRHLATMCRLYNDIGSMARDRDECNLNCADFEEVYLHQPYENCNNEQDQEMRLKLELLALAEHERKIVETCVQRLASICGPDVRHLLSVFIATSDLFGQLYVVKDISSRRLGK